jgi:hypothetical protein
MAIAKHNPGMLTGKAKNVLSMSKKDFTDYAKTKTKNLPKYKNALKNYYKGGE